jgi:hypothetical protein
VDSFNKSLQLWYEKTECVANFGWKYEGKSGDKFLDLLGIDYIVYRKPAPSEESLKSALSKSNSPK